MGVIPHNKLPLDERAIKCLYINERRSAAEISRLFGCDPSTIINRLRSMGVPIRYRHSFGKMLMKRCIWCGRQFSTYRKDQRWCSHQCRSKDKTARLNNVCEACGRDLMRKPDEQFTAFKRRKFCSYECRKRTDDYQKYLDKISAGWFGNGEDHPFWRGGRSHAFSSDLPWSMQRIKALERDGFRCMNCGYSVLERRMCVHHIIPFEESKDNRLDNLITLCVPCHVSIHAQERRKKEYGTEAG